MVSFPSWHQWHSNTNARLWIVNCTRDSENSCLGGRMLACADHKTEDRGQREWSSLIADFTDLPHSFRDLYYDNMISDRNSALSYWLIFDNFEKDCGPWSAIVYIMYNGSPWY